MQGNLETAGEHAGRHTVVCRAQGGAGDRLLDPNPCKEPRKSSRASAGGKGHPGLKVDKTHKCSSPEEEYGTWGLIAHLYSQPQEVKP